MCKTLLWIKLSTDAPATVPSLAPKSKLPKLNYGGLQAPQLHCFATSLQSKSSLHTPKSVQYLKPTPKSLPSPASCRKAITVVQSTSDKDASEAERARSQLRAIFYEIQFSSKLFCETHNSEFLDQHIHRVADRLGTGGFLAYIQIWNVGMVPMSHANASRSTAFTPAGFSPCIRSLQKEKRFQTIKNSYDLVTHIKAICGMALKLDLPLSVALQSQNGL